MFPRSSPKPGGISLSEGRRAYAVPKALLSLVVSLAILALVTLGGCGRTAPPCTSCPTTIPISPTPPWSELPFETIAESEQSYYKSREPVMIVVASPEEIAKVADLLWPNPPGIRERLQALDYTTHVTLAVFQGVKNTGGYSVRIERIARRGNEVVCYALSLSPGPHEVRTMWVTSPFQLVQVTKRGNWQDTHFTLSITSIVVSP